MMYYTAGNIRIGILWILIGIFIGEYPTHQMQLAYTMHMYGIPVQ